MSAYRDAAFASELRWLVGPGQMMATKDRNDAMLLLATALSDGGSPPCHGDYLDAGIRMPDREMVE